MSPCRRHVGGLAGSADPGGGGAGMALPRLILPCFVALLREHYGRWAWLLAGPLLLPLWLLGGVLVLLLLLTKPVAFCASTGRSR